MKKAAMLVIAVLGICFAMTGCTEADQVYVHDCLVMRTADRKLQPGWIASQPDLLAEDWVFAEPK